LIEITSQDFASFINLDLFLYAFVDKNFLGFPLTRITLDQDADLKSMPKPVLMY
jgi:hypothetical protein